MVYLVIAAVAVGAALVIGAIIIIIYLNVCKRLTSKGKEAHYFEEVKSTRNRVGCFFLVIIIAVTAGFMLYAQEQCLGITANEAFSRYLSQCGYDSDDYFEEDCGDYVFYVSRSNAAETDEWLAYQRNGMFFRRAYGVGENLLLPCNDDGTLFASVVKVSTRNGYFYYMSFYNGSVLTRVDVENVKLNGNEVSLTGGKYVVTEEEITSITADISQ